MTLPFPEFQAGQVPDVDEFNERQVLHKSANADQIVTNSTTLVDDDELFFAVKAGFIYTLDGAVYYDGPDAGDFKFTWSAPADSDMGWSVMGRSPAGTTPEGDWQAQPVLGSPTTTRTLGTAGTGQANACTAKITGRLIVVTDGTLTFRWAQFSATAGDLTRRARSYLNLTPVIKFPV